MLNCWKTLAGFFVAICLVMNLVTADEPPPAAQSTEQPRFIDHGDYVEDAVTKLLWQKDGTISGKHNFNEAAEYAKTLQLGVLGGWRVPTAKEFKEIFPATEKPFTNTKYNPNDCCKGGDFDSYWTSDLDKGPDYAFVYQWYAKGGANNCIASKNFCYVRCVRGPATAEELAPLDEATTARVNGQIALLGSEDFQTREKATNALKEEPPKIRPLLRRALQEAKDEEVKARLKLLLRS